MKVNQNQIFINIFTGLPYINATSKNFVQNSKPTWSFLTVHIDAG